MSLTNLLVSVDNTEDVAAKDVQLDYKNSDFDPIDDLDLFVDEETAEYDDEDGGKQEVNFKVVIDAEKLIPPNIKRYTNPLFADKSTAFLSSEESKAKKEARAARFGLENEVKIPDVNLDDKIVENLLSSFNINPENVRDKQKYRLNALYVRGVQNMTTDDIFHYFHKFPANFIEWINDFSCNVVWDDKNDAFRALLNCSKPLKKINSSKTMSKKSAEQLSDEENHNNKSENDDDEGESNNVSPLKRQKFSKSKTPESENEQQKQEESMDVVVNEEETKNDDDSFVVVDTAKHTVPPGVWRVGVESCDDKSDLILIRFSTIDDVKLRNAERESAFYRQYGNPNYGGSVGLISNSRKRKFRSGGGGVFAKLEEERNESSYVGGDLRDKLSKVHRWEEIRSSNRRSSDEDEVSPYSDDEEETSDRNKPKKLRMQMRADDVERKMMRKSRNIHQLRSLAKDVQQQQVVEEELEEGEIVCDDDDDDNDYPPSYHGRYLPRRGGIDLRERLKKFRMKITVDNNTSSAAGEEVQLPDIDDD